MTENAEEDKVCTFDQMELDDRILKVCFKEKGLNVSLTLFAPFNYLIYGQLKQKYFVFTIGNSKIELDNSYNNSRESNPAIS